MQDENAARGAFTDEIKSLCLSLNKGPQNVLQNLRALRSIKDGAAILKFDSTEKLCASLAELYQALLDGNAHFNKNIAVLVNGAAEKIEESLLGTLQPSELSSVCLYCEKAAAGEIFDAAAVFDRKKNQSEEAGGNNGDAAPLQAYLKGKSVSVPLLEVNDVLNSYEQILSRSYKINGELMAMKSNAALSQVISDVQFVQNGIDTLRKRLFSIVQNDEYFVQSHLDFHGFFVTANKKKYFISSEYIVDVTYESELEYVAEKNQVFMRRHSVDDEGKTVSERIPVYALSSLFSEQKAVYRGAVDTILIAEYMHQKVGIIVDEMQKFSSPAKKPLPPLFKNFSMVEGFVFDEEYDMIFILSVPETLRRFRAQRAYDLRKFEANTRRPMRRILAVDDSKTTREIVRQILEGSGFLVECAADGIEAIEKLKAGHYDLIVTDDDMPRMNGEILIDNIRLMDGIKNLGVVCLSSKALERADAFVNKADFTRNDLIERVKDLLNE